MALSHQPSHKHVVLNSNPIRAGASLLQGGVYNPNIYENDETADPFHRVEMDAQSLMRARRVNIRKMGDG